MRRVGGGLVLLTDHWPFSLDGHNSISQRIGLQDSVGIFDGPFALTQHPVTTTPHKLSNLANNTTTGSAPYGLQPNGREMYPVGFHSGYYYTPGISTTIKGCVLLPNTGSASLIPSLPN